MRFSGAQNKGIPRLDWRHSILMSHFPAARHDVIEFPLRAVHVIGISNLARRDSGDFEVEWMPLVQISRIRLAPERLGDALVGTCEFRFGRRPCVLLQVGDIDFFHFFKKPPPLPSLTYKARDSADREAS